MKNIRIYRCMDTIDSMLSAIYDAGLSGYGHDYIQIEVCTPNTTLAYQLFAEYVEVLPDETKANKVIHSIQTRISHEAYRFIMHALLSDQPDKANIVYHFLVYGFHLGKDVIHALQIPWVEQLFSLVRKISKEAQFFREFVRFTDTGQTLLSVIEPKNRITSLIMPHFADRLHCENFIIFDKTHKEAGIYPDTSSSSPGWYLRQIEKTQEEQLCALYEGADSFTSLWQVFFDAIAIEERKNPRLQRNLCPLHYRTHMTEFQS